jgi:glycosyltransferase involved in cell wall biosynthesis
MKILFVTPYPMSRVRVRSYGFVSQLAKRHEVKVITLYSGKREEEDVRTLQKEGYNIVGIQDSVIQKAFRAFRALGTGLPLQVAFDASPGLKAAITALLNAEHFDLLHIEFVRALGALPDNLSIPVVWDAVDCISQLYEQGAQFGATPMVRFIGRGEARRTRDFEQAKLHQFRQVLVTSPRDRQALLNLVKETPDEITARSYAEITVLPHGVDRHYFQVYSGPRPADTLIFSGKMSFHANVAGALMMVKDIMPLIWKCRPQVRLVIAGSNPPGVIRHLTRDQRIVVTGYVPDIRSHIAQARVAVCPLPYAVGIQNKVLEAMALGTPVVASPSAASGLQVVVGQDLLVADTPQAFAGAVLQLLDNQALCNKLMQNGLHYIATYHDWEQIIEQLLAVYDRTIKETHMTNIRALEDARGDSRTLQMDQHFSRATCYEVKEER